MADTDLKNRLSKIKSTYFSKHKEREGKNIAYIVLTHAPIIYKLVGYYKPANGCKINKDGFPGGYCCSFEVVVRNDESAKVVNGVTAKYMCGFSRTN